MKEYENKRKLKKKDKMDPLDKRMNKKNNLLEKRENIP